MVKTTNQQYIGDYNNPIEESLLTNQYFMEWLRDLEHCSIVNIMKLFISQYLGMSGNGVYHQL